MMFFVTLEQIHENKNASDLGNYKTSPSLITVYA